MYHEYGIALGERQRAKLRAAHNKKEGVTIQLAHHELAGPDTLRLTARQLAQIAKAQAAGTGTRLTLSRTQMAQNGGFLNILLPIAAAVLPSAIGWVADKIREARAGSGLRKNGQRRGRGAFMTGETPAGMGAFMTGESPAGMGAFMPGEVPAMGMGAFMRGERPQQLPYLPGL